jgi:HAE1 family hydrophobic/amphiphilic exporter-1
MAVTIIGGVLVSTVLTLFVVPCAYSLMSKLEAKKVEDSIPTGRGKTPVAVPS